MRGLVSRKSALYAVPSRGRRAKFPKIQGEAVPHSKGGLSLDGCLTRGRLLAPAKLNLGLRIVGRREDGYHLLESLFWPVALSDEIRYRRAASFRLRLKCMPPVDAGHASIIPLDETNLCTRALRLANGGELPPLDVVLIKRIPPGSGLGGGSSDAGALLKSLLPRANATAEHIAGKLGADVSYFLSPVPSWVTGIGDKRIALKVTGAAVSRWRFVIVFPREPLPTYRVYAVFRKISPDPDKPRRRPPSLSTLSGLRDHLHGAQNDLEESAITLAPVLGTILSALRGLNAEYAGMSGSGGACFAVFESDKAARDAVKDLRHKLRSTECGIVTAATFRP